MIRNELLPFLRNAFDRGLRLVPLGMGGGAPLMKAGGRIQSVLATNLPEAQQKWVVGDVCAYGVITGAGLLVIDVDLDIPEAKENFNRHNFPDTFKVATPSGGFHLYYKVPKDKIFSINMGSWYGKGIEIKGTNGRVTGWGSITQKGGYQIKDGREFAAAPDWLIKRAERIPAEPVSRGDPAYTQALEYVMGAPEAIENAGGNRQTFDVAQGLIRHNLARPQVEFLMNIYNEKKCKPSWDEIILQSIIDSAFRSSSSVPSFDFDDPLKPKIITPDPKKFYTLADLENMPRPKYLLEGRLAYKGITFLAGRAGGGKTLILVEWAMTLAKKGKRTLCLIGEDMEGFMERMRAWKAYHKLEDWPDNVLIPEPFFPTMMDPVGLTALEASGEKFDLIVIDTFERFITSRLNLNYDDEMAKVMEKLESLSKACGDAAVLCLHHLPRNEDRLKGSNVLDARSTVVLILKKLGKQIQITQQKNRSGRDDQKWQFGIIPSGSSAFVIPQDDPMDEPALKQQEMAEKHYKNETEQNFRKVRAAILQVLRDEQHDGEPFTIGSLTQELVSMNLKLPESKLLAWVKRLVLEGDIEVGHFVTTKERGSITFVGKAYD